MAKAFDRLDVAAPATNVPGPRQGEWTYSHYAALPDDGRRYEIVDGVLYMAPAPNIRHQIAVLECAAYLRTYVKFAGLGRVFVAPIDVQLEANFVVQPDVVVVLKKNLDIIKETRIIGAPDLIVEVASPKTVTYDRRTKYDAYARAGVSEYWLVDPSSQTVEVLTLENGNYQLVGLFGAQHTVQSHVVPGISDVRVEQFFAES